MAEFIGKQLGNYRLIRRLGQGGFAEVYLGQHVHLASKQAAIKILHLIDVDVKKFQEEAEKTEKLVHPHIVRLLDFAIEQATPFLVLDYAPGGSLRARHPKGSSVSLTRVGEYLKDLAPALQYAHAQHILHRDIKPDNMLIGREGELLLSDFGIAVLTQTGRTSFSPTPDVAGTPYYMAPEAYQGESVKESDQYALAVVVYEWLCGSVPFSEGNFFQLGFQHKHKPVPPLRERNPAIPPEVEAVIMKALSKEPKDRFASVQSFATALEHAAQQTQPAQQKSAPHNAEELPTAPLMPPIAPSVPIVSPQNAPFLVEEQEPKAVIDPLVPASPSPLPLALPPKVPPPTARNRKPLLLVGGLASLVVLLIASSFLFAPALFKRPEVMFGFDAAHTHWYRDETVITTSNITQLKPLWSYPTGDTIDSSPVVAGGLVYVGSADSKLYAFDASCQKICVPLWSYATGGGVGSSPAVAGGLVYVGSRDHSLYAFGLPS